MTAPTWYLERPVATLDETLSRRDVIRREFSVADAALMRTSLGLDKAGAVNALSLVAARLALLDGRRMPAGATMVGIRWAQHRPVSVPTTIEARCSSSQSEDSKGRVWIQTHVQLSEPRHDGDQDLAEVTFTFLWPVAETAGPGT